MEEDPHKKRRLALISLISLLVLLGVLFVLIGRGTKTVKLDVSPPIASNMDFAEQIDDSNLYYYSGSAFVDYDISAHQTKPLTPIYSLPTIVNEVLWSKDAALFSATGYSPVDQLYPELVKKSLNPNGYYWWLVDFKSGTISLVGDPKNGADIRGAAWQDDSTFVYAELGANSTKFQVYKSAVGQNPASVATIPADTILEGATKTSILFSGIEGGARTITTLDIATKQEKVIAKDVLDLLANGTDGSTLLITKSNKEYSPEVPRGLLMLYNAKDGNTSEVSSDFSGNALWRRDNNRWLAVGLGGSDDPVAFSNKDIATEIINYTLKVPSEPDITHRYDAAGWSTQGLLLTNTTRNLFVATETLPNNLPNVLGERKIRGGIFETNFTITYVADQLQYSVYILNNPYAENVSAVMQYLTDLGYDPYQLRLKWYADDGVDPGFYLPPDILPIAEPIPVTPNINVGD